MSGHSKWANIKRRKAKVDEQRGKAFTKLGRELIVATRQGGSNPDGNVRLKIAIESARAANMPMERIQHAIARAAGEQDAAAFEEVIYEGYGPGGAAILVEALTDNKKRSAADVRYLFSRHGGSLGEAGCVAWLFVTKGLLILDREQNALDEDTVTMAALEAGAEDVSDEGDSFAVTTAAADLDRVRSALQSARLPVSHAVLTRIPKSSVPVVGKELEALLKLIEVLEDHDDVREVFANHEPSGVD